MILVIYAEVWTWNRSTPLNCYNTSKVSQTADNHKGQIHHHQIHVFFIFNIKTIIKISYIIFYDNLCRTHDSSNSFCWRMGLCANFRRRCLWGVSINYMMLSIFSNYEIQNIYFWDKMWFSKVMNSLTEANANMKLGFKLSYKSKYFFSIEQQWLNYWKNRLNFNNLQLPHQT